MSSGVIVSTDGMCGLSYVSLLTLVLGMGV